jgi:hypothetical protein
MVIALRTMAAAVLPLLLLLLLLAALAGRTDCAPAPEPLEDTDSSVLPSPNSPSPGVSEAIIKRTALSCKGACGSYA